MIERAVVMRGAEIGANCTLRGCIVGGGVRIGDNTHIEGLAVLGEGVTIGADNVIANGMRIFPGRRAAGRRDFVLDEMARSTAPRWRPSTPGPGGRDPRPVGSTCATRCGGSTRPGCARRGARRARGRRHGRLGRRRALAPRGGRRRARAAGRARARATTLPAWVGRATLVLCSSYSGDTEETLAATRRPGAAGARASSPPPAASWPSGRAATACRSSRSRAASSRAPRSATRPSSRSRLPRCAARRRRCATRSRRPPRSPRELAAEWGPDGAEDGEAKALARRAARDGARDLRRRADRRGRLPLEVPVQRERQAAGVRLRAARARPQRDRRLGRGAAFAPFSRGLPRGPRGATSAGRARRADRGDRGGRRAAVERVVPRGETRVERLVSLVLLGDLVSLYPRCCAAPTRSRSRRSPAQGRAGRALTFRPPREARRACRRGRSRPPRRRRRPRTRRPSRRGDPRP